MDALAGFGPDRIGLEGLRPLFPGVRDGGLEQRPGDTRPARRGRDREADDRPDRPVVNGRYHPGSDDPIKVATRREADPADGARPGAISGEGHEARRLPARGLRPETLAELGDFCGPEVLRAQPPVLAPAPARIAALAKEALEGGPRFGGQGNDPDGRIGHRTHSEGSDVDRHGLGYAWSVELPELARPLPEPQVPGEPPSIVELVRRGTLDAEVAALVWVLVEGRIPVVVAAPRGLVASGVAADVLRGLLASLRPDLGLAAVDAANLGAPLQARSARALIHGEAPGGVALAGSLEDVREGLGGSPPAGLSDDELSVLGCVLILAADAPPPVLAADPSMAPLETIRVSAAHYVRPLHRDEHGHAQLLGPAVLATWDPARQAFEHFAWGVLPEIAARLGQRGGDLEADLHHRRDDLGGLAAAGVTSIAEVGRLVAGYRVGYGHAHGSGGH